MFQNILPNIFRLVTIIVCFPLLFLLVQKDNYHIFFREKE